jgi:hypothetical protein
VAVSLSPQQRYNRGLLPQQTLMSNTSVRFPQIKAPPKPKPKPVLFSGYGGASPDVRAGSQESYPNQRAITGGPAGAAQQALASNPYRNMIGGDWEVQGAESEMNARMGRARGDFTSQIRQALIDLGVTDTSKLGSLGSYIDADTISKAAENKYSQTAQISQQETAKQAQSQAALAARGMLSSGQLTTDTERTLAEGESARYGALRDFLGAGQSGLSGLADLNDQLAGNLAQARYAAAARAADLYNQGLLWDAMNQQQGGGGSGFYGGAGSVLTGQGARTGAPPINYGTPTRPTGGNPYQPGTTAFYQWQYNHGLLAQQTSMGDTRIRYG